LRSLQKIGALAALAVTFFLGTLSLASAQRPDEASELNKKVIELYNSGRYSEAIPLAERVLAIREKALGSHHLAVAGSLNNLAAVYERTGHYAEAKALHERALAIREKALGRDHPEVAQSLNNLAAVYERQGRYEEAEPLYRRSLAIREKRLGPGHPDVASALDNLALLYLNQGRYVEAEPLSERALAIRERALGRDHPQVATSLNNLAGLYKRRGRYADAESLHQRALAIREKALGRDHPDVATSLNNLAVLYEDQGRYADAVPLYKRSLAIREKRLGGDHPLVATSLNNLAGLYETLDRYADAELLFQRSLAIREKAFGRDHPDTATALNNLAGLYRSQGRNGDAEPLYRRALATWERALGRDHPDVATALNNLANVYKSQGRYADAEPLYQRSLAISEKALGPEHLDVAGALDNLAGLYHAQDRYSDAEPLARRALAIREKTLGPDHPDIALSLANLALLYGAAGKPDQALMYSRKASAAVIAHAETERQAAQDKEKTGLVEQRADYFRNHVAILHAAAREGIESEAALSREGFEIAQWAVQSSAAAALAQMAVRQANGAGALAQLVRDRQDLESQWRVANQRLDAALAKGDVARASGLRGQLSGLEAKLADMDVRLAREFPDYADLSNPKPLSIAAAQALLGDDEALLFWLEDNKESYVFALTRDGFEWKSIPLGSEALAQKVAALRRGLDVSALHRGLERLECTQAEAEKRGLSRVECGQVLAKECEEAQRRGLARADCATAQDAPGLFDLGLAHELYNTLVAPVEPLTKDKQHLVVVPSGPLTALPFHLLVTEKPTTAVPGDLAAYRDAQWLLKRHAVSVLPSVASLKALRVFARKDEAKSPLIGFGDPIFNAEEESKPIAEQRSVVATRSYTEFFKGVNIDRSMLSKALQRLPETAAELRAVAQNLGAPPSSIYLRQDASETTVKREALAEYRVVYFATHGLVAGDIKGLVEPSLALTLPRQPSETDDGLLTASEVAQLKLNADWVVLSACNTIAGDKPGAEALSGLARAFFYAGARSLLVSHWPVESNAAMRLTTSTFDILKSDPSLGRAEALRRAMLAYMNDAANPLNAYPALWAPFVVVGEGAGRPVAATR
jgi:CHAT domain-containing protein